MTTQQPASSSHRETWPKDLVRGSSGQPLPRCAPGGETHLTSCLLKPRFDGAGDLEALQAFTYNKNLARNKSLITVGTPSPALEAFTGPSVKIVADTCEAKYRVAFEGRPYRSVMAFPVIIGGRVLAVVTVDSAVAGHFTDEMRVEKGIDAAIFPFLKLLGLALIAERKGGRRGRT